MDGAKSAHQNGVSVPLTKSRMDVEIPAPLAAAEEEDAAAGAGGFRSTDGGYCSWC